MAAVINTIVSGLSRLVLQLRAPTGTTQSFIHGSKMLHEVDIPTEKATFAMACFWAPDSLFGVQKGVIRTRVGYCGGTKVKPTYHDLGDHTESIQIDFDPTAVTYDELLHLFWNNHDPTARMTKQYTSLIFFHTPEQKELAEKSMKEVEAKAGKPLVTKVVPASEFYDAEDYHQKYRLQQHPELMSAIAIPPSQLTRSHVAARLNGYVVGQGGVARFEEDVARLVLDEKTAEIVRKLVVKYEGHGLTC